MALEAFPARGFRRELDDETMPLVRVLALQLYDLWQRQRSVTNQLVFKTCGNPESV